ncbi:MAG: effector-associated domain EAD1-containing protein [Rhizonema sp. PD37]|nr:effector-associated domain EAD1-containing protein [Rhizonema sp. PD37]
MSLSGQKRKELQSALIDAFPNLASLEQMLSYELNKNLRAIAGEGSLENIVFTLINTANSQGWIDDLVQGACKSNPGNQFLKTTAQGLLSNQQETSPVALSKTSVESSTQLQKILILAAIPQGLRLDKEIREIESAIRRANNRDLFEIIVKTAVRPQDIRHAIAEEQPSIVHFCGHGMEDGSLILEDDGGNNKPIAPSGLASLFKLHALSVKCVLLNACYSEKSAVAISQYINYVIGMNNTVQDSVAIEFAKGFYDGLGYKNYHNQDVFERAFDEGMVAIEMENLSQAEIPVMQKKTQEKLYKPMDIAMLVNFLVPCLPFLMTVGNQAVEGAYKKLGEDVWTKAKAVWALLQPTVEAKPMAKGAAQELANSPSDADALDTLQKQLKKLLEEDKTLSAEITRLMQSDEEVISRVVNTFNQTISGKDNVVQNSTGNNNKSIGKVHGDATIN